MQKFTQLRTRFENQNQKQRFVLMMGVMMGLIRGAEAVGIIEDMTMYDEEANAIDSALGVAALAGTVTYGATEEFIDAAEAEEDDE